MHFFSFLVIQISHHLYENTKSLFDCIQEESGRLVRVLKQWDFILLYKVSLGWLDNKHYNRIKRTKRFC